MDRPKFSCRNCEFTAEKASEAFKHEEDTTVIDPVSKSKNSHRIIRWVSEGSYQNISGADAVPEKA